MGSIYIAGPMDGIKDYNYPAFAAAAEHLRALGHHVTNPAENFNGDKTLSREVYIHRAITQVLDAQEVVVLPGWAGSRGARLEVSVAEAIGIRVSVLPDFYDGIEMGL